GLRNFFASRSPDELAASLAGGETGRRNPLDFLPYNHKGSPLHFTAQMKIDGALGSSAAELARSFPELADVLPGVVSTEASDAERDKNHLFQALMQFFIRLSAIRPLLLIIEDMHWSDESSLEFLLYLARRIASHPILLLLT